MKTTSNVIDGKLREVDGNGKVIHFKNSTGCEDWYEYDSNGKVIHFKNSDGYETWYDSKGNEITKKQFDKLNQVVTIAGRKYQLKLI